MGYQDKISSTFAQWTRNINDYKIQQSGFEGQVIRLKTTVNMYGDETEWEIVSHDIVTVSLSIPGEIPLTRLRKDVTEEVPEIKNVFLYDILPITGSSRFEDNIEKDDLLFDNLKKENQNEAKLREVSPDIVVDFNNDTIDISIKSDKRICFLRFLTNIGKIRWIYKRIQKFTDDKLREKNNKWQKLRRKYGNRERNRITDMLKKVGVALIRFAKQVKGRIIIENIKWMNQQVGKKTKKKEKNKRNKLAKFPKRFLEFLEDKASEYGVPIEKVNPRNTSITCPICGKKSKKNRVGVYKFRCVDCGFEFDAQFVACMNLLSRFYKPYDPAWERANNKLIFELGGGLVVTADASDEAMIISVDDLLRRRPVWISIISKISERWNTGNHFSKFFS